MQTNQDAQIMKSYRNKAVYSGTDINPAARSSYNIGNSGACKTWHGSPHASNKLGGNKSGGYTSAYAPHKYCNKIAES